MGERTMRGGFPMTDASQDRSPNEATAEAIRKANDGAVVEKIADVPRGGPIKELAVILDPSASELTLTIRGSVGAVVRIMAHGMTRDELEQLNAALPSDLSLDGGKLGGGSDA